MLAWHESQPGSEVAALREGPTVSDRRHQRGRGDGADTGHSDEPPTRGIGRGVRFDVMGDLVDLVLDPLPLLGELAENAIEARGNSLVIGRKEPPQLAPDRRRQASVLTENAPGRYLSPRP